MSGIRLDQFTGSNFSYQHLPFDRFLDDMVELGRERVELWGIAPQLHVPQLSSDEARGIRRRIADRGLTVHCLTPEQVIYPVNVASPCRGCGRRASRCSAARRSSASSSRRPCCS